MKFSPNISIPAQKKTKSGHLITYQPAREQFHMK